MNRRDPITCDLFADRPIFIFYRYKHCTCIFCCRTLRTREATEAVHVLEVLEVAGREKRGPNSAVQVGHASLSWVSQTMLPLGPIPKDVWAELAVMKRLVRVVEMREMDSRFVIESGGSRVLSVEKESGTWVRAAPWRYLRHGQRMERGTWCASSLRNSRQILFRIYLFVSCSCEHLPRILVFGHHIPVTTEDQGALK